MGFIDILGACLTFVPFLKGLGQRLLERKMELELREPSSQIVRGSSGLNIYPDAKPLFGVDVGPHPFIYMWCDLVPINHRVSRREVIQDCNLLLTRRHWFFCRSTITETPVRVMERPGATDKGRAWRPVVLEPQSPPPIITVEASAPIDCPVEELPQKMRLVLEFRMIGPIRYMKINLREYCHIGGLSMKKRLRGTIKGG